MKKRWIWLAVLAALVLLAVIGLDQRLIVRRYTLDAEAIAAPVRLAVLTDLHECDYGPDGARLITAVVAENPDAVLLVGDMFADGGDYAYGCAVMRALADRWPTYYVTGNHEYWTNEVGRIITLVEAAGVTVLDQECEGVTLNGQRISLCGVPDPYAMVYAGAPDTAVQLERTIAQAEPGTLTVLMAHRPELVEQYAASGFDVVVCGHAHGGQVRVPGLINGLCAPNQGWFPRYAGGEYRVRETTMIVSRGLSTQKQWYVPRIFNRPELVIVTLE